MKEPTRVAGRVLGLMALAIRAAVTPGVACSSSTPRPASRRSRNAALCSVAAPRRAAGAVPTLRGDDWARLIIRGYQPGIAPGNVSDCTGAAVRWQEPTMRCRETPYESGPGPQRPITDDDVVISRAGGNLRLVWVIVDRYVDRVPTPDGSYRLEDGEAVGPVALTEFQGDRVVVRAIGTLRTLPRRPRLRLMPIGDRRVLVAEGEICRDNNDPRTCRRQGRLLMLQGHRFVAEPLRSQSGRCLGPARFEYAKETQRTLEETGWLRTFELQTSAEYRDQGVQVHEQVTVTDSDPRRPAVPPRVFRRAASDRAIYVIGNAFVASEPSLWSRVLRVDARTGRVRDGGVEDAGDAGDADDESDMDFIDGGM
ncbi:MAG: hypothetical protein R3A52_13200 [Polyangiales bacterium]